MMRTTSRVPLPVRSSRLLTSVCKTRIAKGVGRSFGGRSVDAGDGAALPSLEERHDIGATRVAIDAEHSYHPPTLA